jgi:ribosomal protein S18 acetylase RimI-like enzyme
MIKVRRARPADIPLIARGQKELNRYHLQYEAGFYAPAPAASKEFQAYLAKKLGDPDFLVLAAEDGAAIAGFALAWVERRPPLYKKRKVGYLSNIYVDEAHRRSGLGTRLYARVEAWFRAKKVDFIQTRAHVRNRATLKTFRRWGLKDLSLTLSKEIKRR